MGRRWTDGSRTLVLRRLVYAAFAVAALAYFIRRLGAFNPDAWLFSLVFYAAELLSVTELLLVAAIGRFRAPPRPWRPATPSHAVDVFVTTYNEPLDVVRRTLVAALAIRYPHQTWLLDDGDRPEMAALARELGARYLPRKENTGAKAGNLNNGLLHTSGEFVAVFDADHAPQPDFLDRLLGYFADPKVCLVQTPQDYFNLDAFQYPGGRDSRSIWHEQSAFHHTQQPRRDGIDAATLCGCSAVLRRRHLDAIGDFPTDTVTEDMHTAVKLQKLGLLTVYHDEPLAFGIAPADFFGFIRQRLRWGEGNMQVARIERLPFARQLTRRQNLAYGVLACLYMEAWPRLVLHLAPIATLLFAVPPFLFSTADFLIFLVPYLFLLVLVFEEVSEGYGRLLASDRYGTARILAGLGATMGLFRRRIRFRVTSKSLSGRIPLALCLPQIGLVGVAAFVVPWAIGREWMRAVAGLPPSISAPILAALAALVVYQAAVAGFVLRKVWRAGGADREVYDHPLRLPVGLSRADGASCIAWSTSLSLAGIRLDRPFPQGSESTVELFLPGETVTVASAASASGDLTFAWPSLAERDVLDQSLHARRWTRILLGQSERRLTPLQWLRLIPAPLRDLATGWRAVLVARPSQDCPRLALLRPLPSPEMILFEPATMLRIIASDDPLLVDHRIEVQPGGEPAPGLECMGAVRCHVRIVAATEHGEALMAAAQQCDCQTGPVEQSCNR